MPTQSYLFNRNGTAHRLDAGNPSLIPKFLRTLRLVVPRESCVYSRINCAGVPRLGLKGFANLQAEQLSPFKKFGVYAAKQGDILHIWTWDKALETEFSDRHGKSARKVVPQSLLATPMEHGIGWMKTQGHDGMEAQLWKNRQCIDTLFFATPPSQTDWAGCLGTDPHLRALGWPSQMPPMPNSNPQTLKPWAPNLLKGPIRLPKIKLEPVARFILWLATAALAASTAAWLSERHAHRQAIAEGVENQKQRIAALEPLQRDREATQELVKWLAQANSLSPRPSRLEILNEIASTITRQGLVVRDLEFSPPTISAILVPVRSSDVRLTAVIGALEANPLFFDVRFVDVVGGNAFKFTWRLKNAGNSPATPAGTTGAPQ